MKVAIIHFRIAKVGGLETRLINYVAYFSKRGDEVTIIHTKRDPNLKLPDDVILSKVPMKWIPKPLRMWRFGCQSQRILKQTHFDFSLSLGRTPYQDLLICPGTHIGFLRAIKRRFYRPLDYLNIYLDRQAFGSSKVILAASEMIRTELIELYRVPSEKIKTLYPPSNPEIFNFKHRKERSQVQKRLGMNPQRKNFLFVSSGHSRKGLHFLLEIFRSLVDHPIHLFIAGAPVKTELPVNVSYLGFIDDMPELYTATDALIHPAFYEPFGQIVSESLMCGTPVIISHKTGASELIKTEDGIIVKSFEPESWVEAIKRCKEKEWSVPENFAGRNGLTNEKHMEKMIATWKSEIKGEGMCNKK